MIKEAMDHSKGKKKHTAEHCEACEVVPKPWWQDQGLWGIALLAFVLGFGRFWPEVAHVLWGYLEKAGLALIIGLLLGGIIDHYVPREYISKWLTGKHRGAILASAGLGFLASSCSHGALALSMELYRKGASVSAVMTFLLASPWASMSLTLLILSMMGLHGLLIVVAAIVVAICTGMIFQRLEHKGLVEPNPHTVKVAADFSMRKDLQSRWKNRVWNAQTLQADAKGILKGARELGQMVLFWVALGFTLSAFLGTHLPESWWSRFFGPTPLGLLTTLALAAVVEVCSEGTAPLAVELHAKTGALGNAFAFLMGGVVTDFTELSAVWSNLGKKAVGWLLLISLPQVFLWGLLLNFLF